MTAAPTLLTRSDVLEQLVVSPRTLARLVASGELPTVRLSPRLVRFDPADVHDFISAHRTAA